MARVYPAIIFRMVPVGHFLRSSLLSVTKPAWFTFPLVLTSVLLLSVSCRKEGQAGPSGPGPVILISIDTLRSDHLPAYGYEKIETPALDALRADAILFERAYTHSPLTLPSHASLLTGELPQRHGIRDNVGFTLDKTIPTLAELLKKKGYETGAAISAYVLRSDTGIGRGFDFFDDEIAPENSEQAIGRIQRDGARTIESAKKWIDGRRGSFFFFVHLYEPHTPYEPPPAWRSESRHPYDSEIVYSDHLVGELIQHLKRKGVFDSAMIVLLSDHGESLGEHGEEEHGIFLYRSAIQVPLIVKLPGAVRKGSTERQTVGLTDVFRMIVEQTGAAQPGPTSSVLSASADDRAVYSETYFPRFNFGWSELHSLVKGGRHYIQAPSPELYDPIQDPGELNNLLSTDRRIYAAMRKELEPMIEAAPSPTAIDPEEASKLAALGYLSGGGSTHGEVLPDPKSKIASFPQIKEAFTLFRDNRFEEALPVFERLRREHPKMPDAWYMSVHALARLHRHNEALAVLDRGMRELPGNPKLAIEGANLFFELEKFEMARKHAELAVAGDPAQAHEIIARSWLGSGNLEKAQQEIRKSLAANKERPLTLMTEGRILQARGEVAAALDRYEHALGVVEKERRDPISSLHLYRGDALYHLGRVGDAEAAFREEIRLFPREVQPHINLILLYLSNGRRAEATREVYATVESIPTREAYGEVIRIMRLSKDVQGERFWTGRKRELFR